MVYISHGSGGVGSNEWNIASFFLSAGYTVAIVDYFTKHGIKKLLWDYNPVSNDNYRVSFNDMLSASIPQYEKIVHIGCSLGGFFGFQMSTHFLKNYCFYPGILAFTDEMLKKDYSNTTVFVATLDTWCDNYFSFHSQCSIPPTVVLADAYHGFMIPDKNVVIPVAKYNLPVIPVSSLEFNALVPCHEFLSTAYGYTKSEILLQHSEQHCIMYLNRILEEIKKI